jgi:predicted  nucleic acid-binding Zn-ribbon protein
MNLVDNIFQLSGIIALIGGAAVWLFDWRKRKSEVKQIEAGAMKGMQAVYDKFVSDVDNRIADLTRELEAAKEERATLLKEVDSMREKSKKDSQLIRKLNQKITKYERELQAYRKELQQ